MRRLLAKLPLFILFFGFMLLVLLSVPTSVNTRNSLDEPRNGCLYYLAVETDPPGVVVVPGEGWYELSANVTLAAPDIILVSDCVRYRFIFWDVDGVSQGEGVDPVEVFMDNDHVATVHYVRQFYLTVLSPYGVTGGEGWYESGSSAYATLNSNLVDNGNGTRRLFVSWSNDASGDDYAQSDLIFMDTCKIAVAEWKTQHYLTISYGEGGSTDPPDSAWWDSGTFVSVQALPEDSYYLDYWELDGVNVGSENPYTVIMDTAHNLHAVFAREFPQMYHLTVKTDPEGVTFISGEGWYNEGESAQLIAPKFVDVSAGIRYLFTHWDVDTINQQSGKSIIGVEMNTNHTATAHYVLQNYLTVLVDPSGLVNIPGEGWYDDCILATLTAPTMVSYTFSYWDVGGVSQGDGVEMISVEMCDPHTATAHYEYTPIIVGGSAHSLELPKTYTWIVANLFLFALFFTVLIRTRKKK